MALHRNKWKPDTCECIVEFEFDDDLPSEKREHVGVLHRACKAHEGKMKDPHDAYVSILKENQNKNVVLKELYDATPNEFKKDEHFKGLKSFTHEVSWCFDENRELVVTLAPEIKAEIDLAAFEKVRIE